MSRPCFHMGRCNCLQVFGPQRNRESGGPGELPHAGGAARVTPTVGTWYGTDVRLRQPRSDWGTSARVATRSAWRVTGCVAVHDQETMRVLGCAGNQLTTVVPLALLGGLSTADLSSNKLSEMKEVEPFLKYTPFLTKLKLKNNPVTKARKYRDHVIVASRSVGACVCCSHAMAYCVPCVVSHSLSLCAHLWLQPS